MVRLTSKSQVKELTEDSAGRKCLSFQRMMTITKTLQLCFLHLGFIGNLGKWVGSLSRHVGI